MDYINFTEEEFSKLTLEEIKELDVNKIKIENRFLIFYLIRKNKIEILKNLINELDLNVKDLIGYSPLMRSCFWNNFEIVTLLIDKLKVTGTLNYIINLKNINGDVPLNWACDNNNFEMIELLLNNGAIPEVDKEGNYKCLRDWWNYGVKKEKLQDFIFEFQSRNIKKVK